MHDVAVPSLWHVLNTNVEMPAQERFEQAVANQVAATGEAIAVRP